MSAKVKVGIAAVATVVGTYLYQQSDSARESTPIMSAPNVPDPNMSATPERFPAPTATGERPTLLSDSPTIGLPPERPSVTERFPASENAPTPPSAPAPAAPKMAAPSVSPSAISEESEIATAAPRLTGGQDIVRVYYGTNRIADHTVNPEREPGDYYTHDVGQLQLGVVEVSVPKDHDVGHVERPQWYLFEKENADEHFVLQRIVPTEESLFLRELNRDIRTSEKKQAFVFIHGFGTTFEAAAWRTGQLKHDLAFSGPAVMYSWPSRGLLDPVSYFLDRDAVRDSRGELMLFLEILATQTGAEKIHVIAHSMGNYLLTPALAQLATMDHVPHPMFDQLILAAPDISAATFKDTIAPRLSEAATRTTIYAADNDYALSFSKLLNRAHRLGHFTSLKRGFEKWPHIDVIDTAGAEFRLFEVGHSDYGGPVLNDVRATLAGLVPSTRGLAQHHVISRFWAVPLPKAAEPTIIQVGHSVNPNDSSLTIAPAKKSAGFWETFLGWLW